MQTMHKHNNQPSSLFNGYRCGNANDVTTITKQRGYGDNKLKAEYPLVYSKCYFTNWKHVKACFSKQQITWIQSLYLPDKQFRLFALYAATENTTFLFQFVNDIQPAAV